ncbi:hypothetical protein H0H81_006730 [Sphagnurus paluster]|uniref:Uncharacterized protein n=1 Tax=Sphagnurus paluster TaxID=117069 RepID=A0A9P7KIU7_9AGAR|nr:hypothetical protein H0H81_006730 [Sphagnurus paluster]
MESHLSSTIPRDPIPEERGERRRDEEDTEGDEDDAVPPWGKALRSTPEDVMPVKQTASTLQPPTNRRSRSFQLKNWKPTQLLKKAMGKVPMPGDGDAWMQEKDQALKQLKRENEKTKRDLADHVAASQRVQTDFDTYRARTQEELLIVKEELRRAEAQYNHAQQVLLAAKEELQRAKAQHERTRNSLKERAMELHSANLFLNQADSLSVADIIAMVNTLNAEILQGAAVVADSLEHARGGPIPTAEAVAATQMLIGEDLVQALLAERAQEDFDPTTLQLALQVCLVYCCNSTIETWSVTGDLAFKELYAKIHREEKQATAGRWRSITQRHSGVTENLAHWLAQCTHGVLLLAGWSNSNTLPSGFENRLVFIGSMVQSLRIAMTDITSMDIKTCIYQSGSSFDPMNMEDTYAEERGTNEKAKIGEGVAGSTELGLCSLKNVDGNIQMGMLLKPKVILLAVLKYEEN